MLYCLDIDGTLIRSFMREGGDHKYPGAPGHDPDDPGDCYTSNCVYGCGCWAGPLRSGGPDGIDPFGKCPNAPKAVAEDYDKLEVLPGRLKRVLELAHRPGSKFALVTNQGGVAFGFQTVEQVQTKVARVAAAFEFFDARPFSVHIAYHHPKATLDEWKCIEGDARYSYRKPGPGMLIEAMGHHRSPVVTTWMVGDMDTDRQAAESAGVRYYDAKEFFDG